MCRHSKELYISSPSLLLNGIHGFALTLPIVMVLPLFLWNAIINQSLPPHRQLRYQSALSHHCIILNATKTNAFFITYWKINRYFCYLFSFIISLSILIKPFSNILWWLGHNQIKLDNELISFIVVLLSNSNIPFIWCTSKISSYSWFLQ